MSRYLYSPRSKHAGFTLIELLVVVAVIGLLIGLLLPAIAGTLETAKTATCQLQLRSIGQVGYTYGADNEDEIFALQPSAVPESLRLIDSLSADGRARRWHAESIIEERLGSRITLPQQLEPIGYTYLVLYDYLLEENIEKTVLCPADGYLQDRQSEQLSAIEPDERYRGFASSYQVVPATFTGDFDQRIGPGPLVTQYRHYETYVSRREFNEVAHPSSKVWMHEPFQLHHGPKVIYALPEAKLPLLMFDGSANLRVSGDSNPGHDPLVPDSEGIFTQRFDGRFFFTPDDVVIRSPLGQDVVFPRYHWTKNGLRGSDF